MKKYLYILIPVFLLALPLTVAFAQAVPANGSLGAGGDCEQNAQACGSGFVCQTNANADDTCVASSGNTGQVSCDVGSVAAGQSCVSCSDGSTANTAAACPAGTTAVTPAATAAPATAAAQSTNNNFTALTNFPAFTNSGLTGTNGVSTAGIGTFFNNLYKICIGIAAALVFLQITLAGFMWMTAGDNTEQVSHARSRIANAVFGLVLVLSPYIVFSIINPSVLNISLNFSGLSGTAGGTGTAASPGATAANTATSLPIGSSVAQVNGTCPAGSTAVGETNGCIVTSTGTGTTCSDGSTAAAGSSCVTCAGIGTASTAAQCSADQSSLDLGSNGSAATGETCSDGTVSAPGTSCASCPGIGGTSANAADCAASTAEGE